LCWSALFLTLRLGQASGEDQGLGPLPSGITYTNVRTQEPWSIHIVRFERAKRQFEVHSMHANASAIGLSSLSRQVRALNPSLGQPVAALNGDFYRRDSAYAGDPRGLQISSGDILSAPDGGATFWLDAVGEPHVDEVTSEFQVRLPDGTSLPFGINEERRSGRPVLYTSSFGASTLTVGGGTEWLIEADGPASLSPLRVGRKYSARVAAIRHGCNSEIPAGKAILSFPRNLKIARVEPGEKVELSTVCSPNFRAVRTAISGGPILIREGKRQKLTGEDSDSFQLSSMFERHPRSALGWNDAYFFLVEVDGRQARLSVGMTLDELTRYMAGLGCENAMNFDGGGSATLWYLGQVRNRPCDGHERAIANSVVITWNDHSVERKK
jgi:hypothetical protein